MLLLSDTDFLSSFLKIGQLETVRDFYRTDRLFITPGVYQELARTDLITMLDSRAWIIVRPVSAAALAGYRNVPGFARLGRGEQETIVLASCLKATVLMSDHRALQSAGEEESRQLIFPVFSWRVRRVPFCLLYGWPRLSRL